VASTVSIADDPYRSLATQNCYDAQGAAPLTAQTGAFFSKLKTIGGLPAIAAIGLSALALHPGG